MKPKSFAVATFILALGFVDTGVRADDAPPAQVDNPMFTGWSKCDVGTKVVHEGDVDGPDGDKIHVVATDTLKGKDAKSVTVEHVVEVGDRPPRKKMQAIPAKVDAADAKKTGDEELKAMDKTFKCDVYDMTFAAVGVEGDARDGTMTIDYNADVPGGVVKAVMHRPDGQDMAFTVTKVQTK